MVHPIETSRLKLIPATVAHVKAEIGDHAALSSLIRGKVPENWPPENTVDALPIFLQWLEAAPNRDGWFGWYALAQNVATEGLILVGGGGFLGPPESGVVNIGYSVLPQFRARGIATEMVGRLIQWAFEEPAVMRIAAETEWANPASARVLTKLGFVPAGENANTSGQRFELLRSN